MKSISKLSLSAVVASMIATTLYAEVPNSGTILNEIKPPKLETKKPEIPSIGSMEYKAPITESDGIEIYVTSFTITNNTVYDDSVLLEIVKPYTNQKLTLAKIKEVAALITKYYRDNGYFVARAYIPAQELDQKGAKVEISIIEGVYGDFKMENSSNVDTKVVQYFMDKLTHNDIISTLSLERQMLLINDLGGAIVSDAKIMPGAAVGTSDFIIEVSPQDKFTGYAVVDNYGSRYTGIHRLNAGAFINSVSGVGDTLSITGLISENANLQNTRIAYDRFIGNSGLNVGISGSYTEYELGEELKNLEAKGDTTHLSTYASYPIIKTRAHTLDTTLSYDHKKLRDKTFATDSKKQTDALTLALSNNINTSWFDRYGTLFTTASITYGDLKFKSDDAKANDVGLDSKGNYSKLNFEISQMQTLAHSLYLTTSLKAQRSLNKNLDSSESFSAGGAYGVRAYKDSEHNGDKGYITSMELSYILPSYKGINHTLSTFVDHAKIWDNHDPLANVESNSRILNGVGLGYNASYKDFNLKATLAHGFGPDKEPTADGGRADKNLFLVQGLLRF